MQDDDKPCYRFEQGEFRILGVSVISRLFYRFISSGKNDRAAILCHRKEDVVYLE